MRPLRTSAIITSGHAEHNARFLGIKQKSPVERGFLKERVTGFEPVAFSLARRRSTTEPHPHDSHTIAKLQDVGKGDFVGGVVNITDKQNQ